MTAKKLHWLAAEEDEADASGKGDPFKPVKEWGSKNRKQESKQKKSANKKAAIKEQLEGRVSWATFSEDAMPDTLMDCPHEHDDAVDHSEDGEKRDMETTGFALAKKLFADVGSKAPVSKLPKPPPGAAEKAKKRAQQGRGLEGGNTAPQPALSHEPVDPASTMDKFNWDNLPTPGLGQI